MEPLPVIPAPPRRRWREFRVRVLPALVFSSALLMIGHLWSAHFVPRPHERADGIAAAPARPEISTNLVASLRSAQPPQGSSGSEL